jgi:sulfane dehydrogenase subunit SoxC
MHDIDLRRAAPPALDPSGPLRLLTLQPHELTRHFTPTRDVFVVAHVGVPQVDPTTWSLDIDGLVRHPAAYTLSDLKRYPKRVIQAFHNGGGDPLRSHEAPRRIANVVWGGVELRTLLEQAGVTATATHVWSFGLDATLNASYVQDVPLERVDAGDALIAYELNGEPLPAVHGFPARLVVAGAYAASNVKWLDRLTLADRARGPVFAIERAASIREVAPNSLIVSPTPGAQLKLDGAVEIWGRAWAARGVSQVSVSLDGGRTWLPARTEPRAHWSWQRFSFMWSPIRTGRYTLAVRATDIDGVLQHHAAHTVRVNVR